MPRYEDLLRVVPRGSFYESQGYILPYRDEPQEFLFTDAAYPNTEFGVFVDDQFRGTVVSDGAGQMIVRVPLDAGEHVVEVENDQTAQRLASYVTVRDYAVWYASYAEALEGSGSFFGVDPAIDSVQNSTKLSLADNLHIEEVYGRALAQPNDLNYLLDSYREVLRGLRQAYRRYPVREAGLEQVAAAFTSSLGYRVPRAVRPVWWLGSNYAPNGNLDSYAYEVTSKLPTLNATSATAVHTLFASVTFIVSGFTNPPTPQRLEVAFPTAWDGGDITIVGTDVGGGTVSEVFTNTGPVVAGYRTRTGSVYFASVFSIANSTAGTTGFARIGLTEARFIEVVEVRGPSTVEGATTTAASDEMLLTSSGGVRYLSYGTSTSAANANAVAIPVSGRYTVPFEVRGGRILGPAFANLDVSGGRDRLYISIDDRTRLVIPLGATSGTPGTNAPSDIVGDINAVFGPSTYGLSPATTRTSGSGLSGDAVEIDSLNITTGETNPRVMLHMDCGDASREVFGIPYYVGDTAAGASAGATSITYTPGDSIGLLEAPFEARVGRGQYQVDISGGGSLAAISGPYATFTLSSPAVLRVGECIEVTGGSLASSDGMHRIYEVVSTSQYRIRHEDTAVSFVTDSGLDYIAWSLGDVVTVTDNDTVTETLTLASGLPRDISSGAQVELNGEMPYVTEDDVLFAECEVVVDVDVDYAPVASPPLSDSLVLAGGGMPEGWLLVSGTSVLTKPWSRTTRTALSIERGATDIDLRVDVPRIVDDLRNWPVNVSFWVEHHQSGNQNFRVDVSFDGGSTWTAGTPTAVAGRVEIDGAARISESRPSLVSEQVVIPNSATGFLVRLVHVSGTSGDRVTVDRCIVIPAFEAGWATGRGTIIRSAQSRAFGEVFYVWSPEDLVAIENTALGISPTNNGVPAVPGQLDYLRDAHGTLARFDVSEYSSGIPVNVRGVYDDSDWLAATLDNMEVVFGVPGRFSHARPLTTSRVFNEALDPNVTTGAATLANSTTHLGGYPQDPNGTCILYENDIPVPITAPQGGSVPYVFTAADTLDIDAAEFSPGSVYTIDYDRLTAATTPVIDLGPGYTDYLWFVDAYVWQRTSQTIGERVRTQGVTFDATGRATLALPSNQDKNSTTLIADDGITQTQVDFQNFSYDNASELRITADALDSDSIYTVTYTAQYPVYVREPSFVLQVRGAGTSGGVASATWVDTAVNAVVTGNRYQQLRISFSGIDNTEDVRVHGLGFRGLKVYGSPPNVPGIILP